MGIKVADPITGTLLLRPVEFEDNIRRVCRLEHNGIKSRSYVTRTGTRIRVTTIV